MKKISIYIFAALIGLGGASCTKNFDEINDDPYSNDEIDPGYLFGNTLINYAGTGYSEWRGNLIMSSALCGQAYSSDYTQGYDFSLVNDYNDAKFSVSYQDALKNGMDALLTMQESKDAKYNVRIAETQVLVQMIFQRLTDMYGDVPYSEAGQGFRGEKIIFPKYDRQEDIYKNMADTLRKYRDVLLKEEGTAYEGKYDYVYGGSDSPARSWAKLANSMLMRMGMRASSADEAWARETLSEAIGHSDLFISSWSTSDVAILQASLNGGSWSKHPNGTGSAINGNVGGSSNTFLAEPYLNRAQENKDPRLFYEACQLIDNQTIWTGQEKYDPFVRFSYANKNEFTAASLIPTKGGGAIDQTSSTAVYYQEGGDLASKGENIIIGHLRVDPNVNSDSKLRNYYQYRTLAAVNPKTIGSETAPIVFFGPDETYYILAEAAMMGISGAGSASDNLRKAIELSMQKYPTLYHTDTSPDSYIALYNSTVGGNNTYDGLAAEYVNTIMSKEITRELIQIERWKSTFLNGYEGFAIWNRTLIPVVTEHEDYYTGQYNSKIKIPSFKKNSIPLELELGKVYKGDQKEYELDFNTGGITGGWRWRRFDYTMSEYTNNSGNVNSAKSNQNQYGNKGNYWTSTRMWISHK